MKLLAVTSPTTAWPAVALAAAMVLVAGPALAMGEAPPPPASQPASGGQGAQAGGADGASAEGADDASAGTECPEGFTLNAEAQTCEQTQSGISRTLPAIGWAAADPGFVAAAILVHSGSYEAAIEAFTALGRPDDPYVLNYLGYANRKLGRVEPALAFYQRALAIRPDYARARSYLGEGYVALGRIEEAREELSRIAELCGTGCEPYRVLDAAISGRGPRDNS